MTVALLIYGVWQTILYIWSVSTVQSFKDFLFYNFFSFADLLKLSCFMTLGSLTSLENRNFLSSVTI